MPKREPLEPWEQQLINEGEALKQMGRMVGGTKRTQKRPPTCIVATVHHRDKAALHVGYAPDRVHG